VNPLMIANPRKLGATIRDSAKGSLRTIAAISS
jgi:hypothetical protein